jgi:hypothetical protein
MPIAGLHPVHDRRDLLLAVRAPVREEHDRLRGAVTGLDGHPLAVDRGARDRWSPLPDSPVGSAAELLERLTLDTRIGDLHAAAAGDERDHREQRDQHAQEDPEQQVAAASLAAAPRAGTRLG